MQKSIFTCKAFRFTWFPIILLCLIPVYKTTAQDLLYAKGFTNSVIQGGTVEGKSIKFDAAGNCYVFGHFMKTADFDPGTGVANLFSAGYTDLFLAKYDASGNYLWAKKMGGVEQESARALAVDATGNCYITGFFGGTVDFDPGAGTQNLISAGGLADAFIARYDASGNYISAMSIGGTGDDRGMGITLDASGNYYITGYFSGTADFDPGAGTQNLTAAVTNMYLAKYNASGNYVWAKVMSGTGGSNSYDVAVDASGNSYVTGFFGGTVDFDPSAVTQNLISAGLADAFLTKYDASGNYVWGIRIGGTSYEYGQSVAVDASGNPYVTGWYNGTVDFDPGAATQNLVQTGTLGKHDTYLAKYDASGNYVWAKSIGGTDYDQATFLVVDASGNSYLSGYFYATCDFDPGAGVANLVSSGGLGSNIFLAKYDVSGNLTWVKGLIGGVGQGYGLYVDATGNTFTTGTFANVVDFDPDAGSVTLNTGSTSNGYILKLNSSGAYVDVKQLGNYNNATANESGNSIKVDALGNTYVTGSFSGTVDFDPGTGTQNLTAVGSSDIFLAKYNSAGNYVWAISMGGSGSDAGYSLATDASGNIYVTGQFANAVDFDAGAGIQTLTAVGSTDIFLAKYDASGNFVWAKGMGGTSNEVALAVTTDGSNNSYITGYYNGACDFDPDAVGVQNLTSLGGNEIFLAKYDASGNYVWAKSIGSTGADAANGLATDASGNSYLTGSFTGTVDFDPGAPVQNVSASANTDIFLAKYDASGNYVWAKGIGGSGTDGGYGIAIDGSGNSFITGLFAGTVDFDPGAATQNRVASGSDIFLAKYDASGNYVWAKSMGGVGTDQGYGVALDASGNSYITGYFSYTVDFDPGAATQNLTSISSSNDIFLAKYDAAGDYVWAKAMGGSGSDIGLAVAAEGNNSYITGYFNSQADFNPDAGTSYLQAINGNDLYIAKYGPPVSLSVQLQNLTGRFIDNNAAVLLQWTIATPEDPAYFIIESKGSNNHITTAGSVDGCSVCNGPVQYSYKDYQPAAGTSYYRLKLVYPNGNTAYSKWISVYKNENLHSLLLSPTVTTGIVKVIYEHTGTRRQTRLMVFDGAGKLVQQNQQQLVNGSNQLHIDLTGQAAGIYYVQLTDQNGKILGSSTAIHQ